MLDDPPVIVKRSWWGAKQYVSGLLPLIPPVSYVVVHYYTGNKGCYSSNTCEPYVKKLQRRAVKERQLADIPFSFLISPVGEIYEGRGWDVMSDKSLPYHKLYGNKYDIVFLGNYLVKKPDSKLIKVLETLIKIGVEKKYIKRECEILQVRDKPMPIEMNFEPDS